jgi:hypothetical protein
LGEVSRVINQVDGRDAGKNSRNVLPEGPFLPRSISLSFFPSSRPTPPLKKNR